MKKLNKLFTLIASLVMVLAIAFPISATNINITTNSNDILYTVYNEKGEVVEEGLIPQNSNGRYDWSGSITLDNGWYTSFRKPGPSAFYVTDKTDMDFSYSLDRSAKISYQFFRDSVSSTSYPTTWKSGTKTARNATITHTADKTNYYYVGITNASSDTITISNVSFTF